MKKKHTDFDHDKAEGVCERATVRVVAGRVVSGPCPPNPTPVSPLSSRRTSSAMSITDTAVYLTCGRVTYYITGVCKFVRCLSGTPTHAVVGRAVAAALNDALSSGRIAESWLAVRRAEAAHHIGVWPDGTPRHCANPACLVGLPAEVMWPLGSVRDLAPRRRHIIEPFLAHISAGIRDVLAPFVAVFEGAVDVAPDFDAAVAERAAAAASAADADDNLSAALIRQYDAALGFDENADIDACRAAAEAAALAARHAHDWHDESRAKVNAGYNALAAYLLRCGYVI